MIGGSQDNEVARDRKGGGDKIALLVAKCSGTRLSLEHEYGMNGIKNEIIHSGQQDRSNKLDYHPFHHPRPFILLPLNTSSGTPSPTPQSA